jgi:hypothetical protein
MPPDVVARQALRGGQLRKLLERNVPPELFAPISDDELLAAYQDQFGIGESSGESRLN